jgi:plastocyanin
MITPMTKENIDRVKAGQMKQAGVEVPAPDDLRVGDRVTFYEADFYAHRSPTYVNQGASVTVTLTKAVDRDRFAGGTRFEVEWA